MKPNIIKFIPALIWSTISFVLLVLPGSDLPKSGLFDLIYFDKWVHIGMFGLLTIFWGYPFLKTGMASGGLFTKIAILVIIYGVSMEFIQKYFAYERSFDIMDIMADAGGVGIAYFLLIRRFKKLKRVII